MLTHLSPPRNRALCTTAPAMYFTGNGMKRSSKKYNRSFKTETATQLYNSNLEYTKVLFHSKKSQGIPLVS